MPSSFHWIAYILLVYCSLMSYMNYNRFSNEPKEKYIVHVGVIKINFILQIYQKYIVSLKKNPYILSTDSPLYNICGYFWNEYF